MLSPTRQWKLDRWPILVGHPTVGHTEEKDRSFLEQLIGFVGEKNDTIGYLHLLTTFGDEKGSKSIIIKYLLVNAQTLYNVLIGHPSLNELSAIISTPHLTMTFFSEDEKIITMQANQITTRECYAVSLRICKGKKEIEPKAQLVACTSLNNNLRDAKLDQKEAKKRAEPT